LYASPDTSIWLVKTMARRRTRLQRSKRERRAGGEE
jgi:hypothetical protein